MSSAFSVLIHEFWSLTNIFTLLKLFITLQYYKNIKILCFTNVIVFSHSIWHPEKLTHIYHYLDTHFVWWRERLLAKVISCRNSFHFICSGIQSKFFTPKGQSSLNDSCLLIKIQQMYSLTRVGTLYHFCTTNNLFIIQ